MAKIPLKRTMNKIKKIKKLFTEEGKDTSKDTNSHRLEYRTRLTGSQTSSFSPPWVRRLPSKPRRLLKARLK